MAVQKPEGEVMAMRQLGSGYESQGVSSYGNIEDCGGWRSPSGVSEPDEVSLCAQLEGVRILPSEGWMSLK